MSSEDPFEQYVEALKAVTTVEDRQRTALRKAVESSAAAEAEAKAQMADQGRLYDNARRQATDAEGRLAELRTTLGITQEASKAADSPAGRAPTLIQVRSQIDEVNAWATDGLATAESLLRTRARIAAKPVPEPTPTPAPVETKQTNTGLIVGAVLLIVLLVAVIAAIALN